MLAFLLLCNLVEIASFFVTLRSVLLPDFVALNFCFVRYFYRANHVCAGLQALHYTDNCVGYA